MAAGKYNFLIEQGSHFNYTLSVSDDTGDVIDLSGYTGKMQIKSDITASSSLLELSTTGNYMSITGAQGLISLSVPNTVTSTLDFDTAVYDLIITSGTGVVTRLVEGSVNLSTQVTR